MTPISLCLDMYFMNHPATIRPINPCFVASRAFVLSWSLRLTILMLNAPPTELPTIQLGRIFPGAGGLAHRLNSPNLRLPHPFTVFEGWETTTVSVMEVPRYLTAGFSTTRIVSRSAALEMTDQSGSNEPAILENQLQTRKPFQKAGRVCEWTRG